MIILSRAENNLLESLGECWNEYLELVCNKDEDEVADFRNAIHDAQRIIMSRPVMRELRR